MMFAMIRFASQVRRRAPVPVLLADAVRRAREVEADHADAVS
jgi:hypothetical protein